MVQMAEPAQAQLAQTYLDKVKLQGRVIRVTPSKHQLVQMPKEGQHVSLLLLSLCAHSGTSLPLRTRG